jgi:hypothetical protein
MVRNASASEIVIEGNPATVFLQPTTGLNVAASSVLVVGARVANSPPHNFFGDISELIIYNRILSAPERDSVRNYLKTKWGIAQNKLLLNPAKTGYLLLSPSRNDRLALN